MQMRSKNRIVRRRKDNVHTSQTREIASYLSPVRQATTELLSVLSNIPSSTENMDVPKITKKGDYVDVINFEIASFEKEIQRIKALSHATVKAVGTEEERWFLERNIVDLQKDMCEMCTKFQILESHVNDTKTVGKQQIARLSKVDTENPWTDPKYLQYLQNRPLDDGPHRLTKKVLNLYQCADIQMENLQVVLHKTWMKELKIPEDLQRNISSVVIPSTKQDFNTETKICSNNVEIGKDSAQKLSKYKLNENDKGYSSSEYVVEHLEETISQESTADFLLQCPAPSKISTLQKLYQKYKTALQTMVPRDAIREFRNEIHLLAEKVLERLEKNLESVLKSTEKADRVLKVHSEITSKQIEVFEKFVYDTRLQISRLYHLSPASVITECNGIMENFKDEAMFLMSFSPLYAYKEDITDSMRNKVTVVVADSLYSAEFFLQFLFRKHFKHQGPIAICKDGAILVDISCRTFKSFFKDSKPCSVGLEDIGNNVVFVTVNDLLVFSVDHPDFSPFSCVIMACELKRTTETDLLLKALKNCVEQNSGFRLVILLLPFDNSQKYIEYFSSPGSVGSFTAPDLLYSVKTLWKSNRGIQDYIEDTVKTSLSIHVTQEPGDVLVFLPAVKDIFVVIENLKLLFKDNGYDNFSFTCIFDSEIKYLDTSRDNGKYVRNFILTAGFVESVLFPRVKYVIDTGLIETCDYDSERCSEVKKLSYISRSRSKLRKSCVGRYRFGFCYRLYTKHTYRNEMTEFESSAVSTKNPLDTVFKILQYFPEDLTECNFVEPFAVNTRDKAISMLELSNTLKDGRLTKLGKNIVTLPFNPKYSKLITLGIQWGFPFEAALLVAFCLADCPLFKNDLNPQLLKYVEVKKQEFLLNDSETLTYVNAYKMWVNNDYLEQWCEDNFLNYDVLQNVREKVKQILNVVCLRLKKDIVMEVKACNDSDWYALQQMMLECFRDNLAVYSGHSRSGYRLQSSGITAFLNPLSPVVKKGVLPKFVVFSKLYHSSKAFMNIVTAIPEDLVVRSLDIEPLVSPAVPESYVIEPVGISFIKALLHRQHGSAILRLEEKAEFRLECSPIFLEPSEELGNITLYAPPEAIEKAKTVVQWLLEDEMSQHYSSEDEQFLSLTKGSHSALISVLWTKGALTLSAKYTTAKMNTGESLLSLEDNNVDSVKQIISVTWSHRLCKGYGLVSFVEEGFIYARIMVFKSYRMGNRDVEINTYDDMKNTLIVSGLSPYASVDKLHRFLKKILPKGAALDEIRLAYHKENNNPETVQKYKVDLENICLSLLKPDMYRVSRLEANEEKTNLMSATIRVSDFSRVEELITVLTANTMHNGSRITAAIVYSCTLHCSVKIFCAVKAKLDFELCFMEKELLITEYDKVPFEFEAITQDDDSVTLKFSSHSHDVITRVLHKVNDILNGFVLSVEDIDGLHKLFSHSGHLWLRALEKEEHVYILEKSKLKTMHIFGDPGACLTVRQRIKNYLNDAESETVSIVDLSRRRNIRKVLRNIIHKYGIGLSEFIKEYGLRFAEIDIRNADLVLHGVSGAIEKAQKYIENMAKKFLPEDETELFQCKDLCPVCGLPPIPPSFRLEMCGHLYCTVCLRGLITETDIPIKCCEKDCAKELILDDIYKGLDYDEKFITDLVHRSLASYIASSSVDIKYCPIPDCSMFYMLSEVRNNQYLCPLCQNSICSRCNVPYHHGYTCDVYQGSQTDPDFSYKEWVKDKRDINKLCPSCKMAIEKHGGCNHMHCTKCNCHFCWTCSLPYPQDEIGQHVVHCTGN